MRWPCRFSTLRFENPPGRVPIGDYSSSARYSHSFRGLAADENKTKVRGLAYLDAKQKAEGLLSQSGFKLGKPLLIDDQRSDFPVFASARMLSDAVAPNVEPKTPLLENRKIRFEQEIRVKFKIVE